MEILEKDYRASVAPILEHDLGIQTVSVFLDTNAILHVQLELPQTAGRSERHAALEVLSEFEAEHYNMTTDPTFVYAEA